MSYSFTHSQEVEADRKKMRVGLFTSIDLSYFKFHSREVNTGLSLDHENLPFSLKLLHSYRTNMFDKHASLEAFKDELMPSSKFSVMLESIKHWKSSMLQLSAELGVPSGAPNFLKGSFSFFAYKMLWNNRFKVGYDFAAGLIKTLSSTSARTHTNDRFFLGNEYGFSHLSHSSPSICPQGNSLKHRS
eukprot:TRINITY_DN1415_c0_g6_i1.p1 TRINITY_DN1415_c0_g6~~TRINITY_DN1415_c0_g6_i1.p1  ORF type:complete len:188 (+),score=52.38 TRINITY_DN1415_c0_g6_i1:322-885(+)